MVKAFKLTEVGAKEAELLWEMLIPPEIAIRPYSADSEL